MAIEFSVYGIAAIIIFTIAYLFVMTEELTHIRKSKPVLLGAGLIWTLVALSMQDAGVEGREFVEESFNRVFLEFSELFVFLIVAMTFINSMAERNVFEYLRYRLVAWQLGYRSVFWITGILAFFISPVADNLTTALLMCAVVLAVGRGNPRFTGLSCINIVVGANAGGAFSPFGDITTLMVWQKEMVEFWGFFSLFLPSVINFLIPAAIMSFAVPKGIPAKPEGKVSLKLGARRVIFLFLVTISITVFMHQAFNFPAVFGMLFGLSFLKMFGFYLRKVEVRKKQTGDVGDIVPFDVFENIARAEWDTLFFFYGVIACVGGLAAFGYLNALSITIYGQWGATLANSAVGVFSAVIDNIPIMYAVLTMTPDMDTTQWLLVTLTAGVGGSLLSIGSAAGVALMGQARGIYTFFSHLKWTWAIAIGYVASIYLHLWLSGAL